MLGNNQYHVHIDGSGRITLRNHKHLKPICYWKLAKLFPQLVSPNQVTLKSTTGEGKKEEYRSQPVTEVDRKVPRMPSKTAADRSMVLVTPNAASTPKCSDAEKSYQSDVFMTPLRTPSKQLSFTPTPVRDVPAVVLPRKSVGEVSSIHPELRLHN